MYKRYEALNTDALTQIAYEDLGRNYFILLGLSLSKLVYDEVYYFYHRGENDNELEAILLKRRSGNLQLMTRKERCSTDVITDFQSVINSLVFKKLITSRRNIESLNALSLFSSIDEGALISATDQIHYSKKQLSGHYHIKNLHCGDVDAVEALYKQVFKSFTPAEVIKEKLLTGRGRGLALFNDDELIAVAQTDFESEEGAIVVGVASHPDYQQQGFGHVIMSALCHSLIEENKRIYLHYDSPIAGKLYDKMGFIKIDQILHCTK